MAYPADEQEFRRDWAAKGSEVAALKMAALLVETRAGKEYVRGQDAVANALRDASREIRENAKKASAELDGFIEESGKRDREMRRVLGH